MNYSSNYAGNRKLTSITPRTFTASSEEVRLLIYNSVYYPLSVTNPNTTPVISMTQADGGTNGFLSFGDWNTFNNKISSIVPGTGITTTAVGGTVTINASTASLPAPTIGSLLYANPSNVWAPTNPSNISSDGNSISVTNTTTTGSAGTFANTNAANGTVVLDVSTTGGGNAINATSTSGYALSGVPETHLPYGCKTMVRAVVVPLLYLTNQMQMDIQGHLQVV